VTGLKTRSCSEKDLGRWADSADTLDEGMSVIFIDIDHFKDINDTYGRLFGDRVIGSVGQAVSQPARGDDAFGRYGGEEFLMLLPHTALFDSQKTAEAV